MFTLLKKLKAGPRRRRARAMRRHLPRVYGLRQAAAQTRNCGVCRPYRRKVQQNREPAPPAPATTAQPPPQPPLRRDTV